MSKATFDELLDAVEHLPPDEQAELVAVIQRRLAAQRRQRIVVDVLDAEREFEEGKVQPRSIDEILSELKP